MIAFGVAVAEPEIYRRHAEPGIHRAAEPDSTVFPFAAIGPLARTYNLILDEAARRDDLEALVLVNAHVEIDDPAFCDRVRDALRDPGVAVAGCAGATGVRTIAWWEGAISAAPIVHRYGEHGGGEIEAYSWAERTPPPAEVDAVDGMLLVLSPWAVRTVRFDERLRGHGFDLDFCFRARAAGRKVVTADLRVIHHRSLELVGEVDAWVDAHVRAAEIWEPDTLDEDGWRRRARRAEAEREAARAVAYSNGLVWDALVAQLEHRFEAATETRSWRATRPLRSANRLRGLATRRLSRG